MSLVYFLPHCMSARGCADALVGLLRYARGYSDLPKHNEVQIATVGFAPTTEKEKAEVRDYIVATERNVLTRTKHYLVKSNGEDLNLHTRKG